MMHGDKLKVFAEWVSFRRKLAVTFFIDHANDRQSVAKPIEFEDCTDKLIERPTIEDGRDFLQACLEAAWQAGLRPAGFADVPLQVAALKYHLEDMRALVFDRTKPERPIDAR